MGYLEFGLLDDDEFVLRPSFPPDLEADSLVRVLCEKFREIFVGVISEFDDFLEGEGFHSLAQHFFGCCLYCLLHSGRNEFNIIYAVNQNLISR